MIDVEHIPLQQVEAAWSCQRAGAQYAGTLQFTLAPC
jgi:hypothetical protein